MEFTKPRATLEELLVFANAVREAGGGNPLDALMPAVPEDASQCLIAKNLNFNCTVAPGGPDGEWCMGFGGNQELRNRIAESLDLAIWDYQPPTLTGSSQYFVILPPEIGQVANDFDNWDAALRQFDLNFDPADCDDEEDRSYYRYQQERFREYLRTHADHPEVKDLLTFLPYVEQSEREAYSLASMINEKGEIIL